MRDKQISAQLTSAGFPVPKLSTHAYIAQWYEVYNYNPNQTLKQHIQNHLSDDKIFETYKQVLDFQAKLAESSLDYIYSPVGKYFYDVYKISPTTARPEVLFTNIIRAASQYHNVRLVHCDLHPDNIICKEDGSLDQIIDITGIALASEEFAMISLLDNFPFPDMTEELMDYYAIGQCTPGVIAVNTATFVGQKYRGLPGAIFCTLGVVFPSLVIITLIAAFLMNFAHLAVVQNAFAGVRVCVCVLIFNAVVKLWKKSVVDKKTLVIFLLVFAGSTLLDLSPVLWVLASGAAGLLIKKWEGKKA